MMMRLSKLQDASRESSGDHSTSTTLLLHQIHSFHMLVPVFFCLFDSLYSNAALKPATHPSCLLTVLTSLVKTTCGL